MKALFAGLGSAGQRHLVNLKRLLNDDVELIAFRQTNHRLKIEDCRGASVASLEDEYGLRSFTSLDAALDEAPDVAFVTNPAALHMTVASAAAKRGCHLFIEKPLSHSLDGVDDLMRHVDARGLTAAVGYQTRFHPCVQATIELLRSGEHGHVLSAAFEWGTWLPGHHRYEDHRESCNAVAAMGGGAVLSLSHEIDLLHSFFGPPFDIHAAGGTLGDLDIDAEDTALALLSCKAGGRHVPVSLDLSFAQTKETRTYRIRFAYATLSVDLVANTLELVDRTGDVIRSHRFPSFNRNDLFVAEVQDFLESIRERRSPVVSLADGVAVLRTALRIKEQIGGGT